jgi:hypothetical protein
MLMRWRAAFCHRTVVTLGDLIEIIYLFYNFFWPVEAGTQLDTGICSVRLKETRSRVRISRWLIERRFVGCIIRVVYGYDAPQLVLEA